MQSKHSLLETSINGCIGVHKLQTPLTGGKKLIEKTGVGKIQVFTNIWMNQRKLMLNSPDEVILALTC